MRFYYLRRSHFRCGKDAKKGRLFPAQFDDENTLVGDHVPGSPGAGTKLNRVKEKTETGEDKRQA